MIVNPCTAEHSLFVLGLSCLLVLLGQDRNTAFSIGIAPRGPDSGHCVLLPPSRVGADGLQIRSLTPRVDIWKISNVKATEGR